MTRARTATEISEIEPLTLGSNDSHHKLAENIVHFARLLRRAGLPIGPAHILKAVEAVQAIGVCNRGDFYSALHASVVTRPEQTPIFDDAFRCFWRNPEIMQRMMAMMMPTLPSDGSAEAAHSARRRILEAMEGREGPDVSKPREDQAEIELDAAMTASGLDSLSSKDFAEMSLAEMQAARAAMSQLELPFPMQKMRRYRSGAGPKIDMRKSLREMARQQDAALPIMRQPRQQPPPIVALCDISGSMDRYARMVLHFMHGLCLARNRIHVFVFGTRLTNITHDLKRRDPDEALERVSSHVEDWSGGTRIGAALRRFNVDWSRRVLGQGAALILVTDGLERSDDSELATEMERLHKSCSRLLWLNPLLRFDGYAPKAKGAAAMIKHVDDFRPIHNLDSLAMLSDALRSQNRAGDRLLEAQSRLFP